MKLAKYAPLLALGLLLAGCKKDSTTDTAASKAPLTKAKTPKTSGPSDIVYAASSAIRVIDFATGKVVASIPLKSAVHEITFSGSTAYIAASRGLFVMDSHRHTLLEPTKFIDKPVRHVDLSDDGKTVDVLVHDVIVREDGIRDVKPFQLVTFDASTGAERARAMIGQRIFYAAKRMDGADHAVVVGEDGTITLKSGSQALNDEGTTIDPHAGISTPDQPVRVRHEAVRHGTHAYLPVEGYPSRVLDVDLKTGAVTAIPLDRAYPLRGIGVTPDGKTLLVNVAVGVVVVDLETKEIRDRISTPDSTSGIAISSDGRYVYTAQVVDGTGGAIHALSIDPPMHAKKVHLDDISPWALGVRP